MTSSTAAPAGAGAVGAASVRASGSEGANIRESRPSTAVSAVVMKAAKATGWPCWRTSITDCDFRQAGSNPATENPFSRPRLACSQASDIARSTGRVSAICSGATFVARTTSFHATQIDKLIAEGIKHKGMAIIEVLDDCPTTYGRRNKFRSVVDMMKRLKDIAVPVAAAAKMTAEQLEGKVLTGVLYQENKPEYTEQYAQVIAKAQGA